MAVVVVEDNPAQQTIGSYVAWIQIGIVEYP